MDLDQDMDGGDRAPPAADGGILELPTVLDALAADELVGMLRGAEGAVTLDGAAVERLSTIAVQVLLAASREGEPAAPRFRLLNPSPALVAGFAELGLAEHLESWTSRS
jgi:anti-anti-sigma regulatory factor